MADPAYWNEPLPRSRTRTLCGTGHRHLLGALLYPDEGQPHYEWYVLRWTGGWRGAVWPHLLPQAWEQWWPRELVVVTEDYRTASDALHALCDEVAKRRPRAEFDVRPEPLVFVEEGACPGGGGEYRFRVYRHLSGPHEGLFEVRYLRRSRIGCACGPWLWHRSPTLTLARDLEGAHTAAREEPAGF